ncbi:hypothetical protein ACR75C_07390 [Thomasclavelia ramosa]
MGITQQAVSESMRQSFDKLRRLFDMKEFI